ncbi:Piso0_004870 [Millerozyma farinosa CBS 7064]|uniref:Piso0_004870 protein n=1 Tax=Pichia sorbitophila (strain ATCC MYA-4447 / BCRC 22081 / CBS 7064 / NBRC 10061 / NRRL Y-12695) TaxID=559304 RepID=G8Y3L7_PICSO|nr:Piso0_004870 [Millerozyma farinosa CBS 7064]
MVSQEFTDKANAVNGLTKTPSNDELLELYGLYKQATVGDNNTPQPSVFNMKNNYKWKAWDKLKGTSQEDAEKQYIELADELLQKYN